MPILTPLERIGTRVADKYELTAMLGRGGMGVVYQAVHRWTGRRVAVKLIDPSLADDPDVGARFLNEARAAAAIAHAHVVDVLDMGRDDDGTVYQALELLEGETLGERLRREGPLSVHETVRLLAPVMDALHHAHRAGIVHRDVKPGNVFLRKNAEGESEAVLLDFGMAKLLDGQSVTTRSSTVLGTPHYMAPEQALASLDVGPAADIWAMGTILFQCLTGKLPFGEGPPAAYLARVVYQAAPALHSVRSELPAQLCAAVDRALSREPSQRQHTMGELMADVLASAPGTVLPASFARRVSDSQATPAARTRSTQRPGLLLAFALATLVAALGVWLYRVEARSAAQPVRTPPASVPVQADAKPAPVAVPPAETSERSAKPEPRHAAKPPATNAHPRDRRVIRSRPKPDGNVAPVPSEEALPRGMTTEW
jgi:serine/threonine protein kinase